MDKCRLSIRGGCNNTLRAKLRCLFVGPPYCSKADPQNNSEESLHSDSADHFGKIVHAVFASPLSAFSFSMFCCFLDTDSHKSRHDVTME